MRASALFHENCGSSGVFVPPVSSCQIGYLIEPAGLFNRRHMWMLSDWQDAMIARQAAFGQKPTVDFSRIFSNSNVVAHCMLDRALWAK